MSTFLCTSSRTVGQHLVTPSKNIVRNFRKSSTVASPNLITWYSKKLDTHPLATKMISAGVVAFSGDVLSQRIRAIKTQEPFVWDAVRTLKFATLGVTFIAPLTHYWYGYLHRLYPGKRMKSVAIRVAIDQFCFEPVYVPSFLSAVWIFEGEGVDDVKDLLYQIAPKTLVANWIVWIPATAVIFRSIPTKFQVLAANMVGFLWNAYVSFTAHAAEDEHDKHSHGGGGWH